ncbi:MAG TPA: sigma-70 family RNA polymerase sigma factor [Chthonomonadaceae bacterium]|nr:sigma-70 family RNA polymerase sigma factor [Chthonomonadaceae bacterium]
MKPESDEITLALRARNGDQAALAELIRKMGLRLFAWAFAELQHREDAQDAVAAAIFRIYRHVADLQQPEHVHAWMRRIVQNEARRLQQQRQAETAGIPAEETPSAISETAQSLLRLDVERALKRLPYAQARTLAWFYLAGLSIEEIARRTRRPEGTIKRWLHAGRRQLAGEMKGYAPMTPMMKNTAYHVLVRAVGKCPNRVAAHPDTGKVYVVNSCQGSLSVLDTRSDAVIGTIPVGKGPRAIALNPPTDRLYVANGGDGTLSVVDTGTDTLITTLSCGGNSPSAIAVQPLTHKIYVANAGDNTVAVFDGQTNTLLTVLTVGSVPFSLAVQPATNRIYVANWGSYSVSVIDGATDTLVETIPVGVTPMDISVNLATNRIYVTHILGNRLSVIDGATHRVIKTVHVGSNPYGVAVNAATNTIYVTRSPSNMRRGSLSVIDGETNQVVANIRAVSGMMGLTVTPTNKVYAANVLTDTVSVFSES